MPDYYFYYDHVDPTRWYYKDKLADIPYIISTSILNDKNHIWQ